MAIVSRSVNIVASMGAFKVWVVVTSDLRRATSSIKLGSRLP